MKDIIYSKEGEKMNGIEKFEEIFEKEIMNGELEKEESSFNGCYFKVWLFTDNERLKGQTLYSSWIRKIPKEIKYFVSVIQDQIYIFVFYDINSLI